MFKKIVCYFLLFVFLIQLSFNRNFVVFASLSLDSLPAESYVLMDSKTGSILYCKNCHERRSPASLTKTMIMLLAAERIDDPQDDFNFDTKIRTPKEATTKIVDETSLWLAEDEEMSVKDLLKSVAIKSANDAARSLGIYLSSEGTEKSCVELMNEKAKQLGLKNTHFMNASGLDEDDHYSTAYDVAIMTRELLEKHPWITDFTSTKVDFVRSDKLELKKLINTNYTMLKTYQGCNGFKTGTTDNAGRCLCSTANRNGMSIISVCLGAAKKEDTITTNEHLLDYAFNNFRPLDVKKFKIDPKGVKVIGGKSETVYGIIENKSKSSPLINKTLNRKVENKIELKEKVNAPIKKGDVIGKIKYILNNKELYSQNLVADRNVEKMDWFFVFSSIFKNFFFCK